MKNKSQAFAGLVAQEDQPHFIPDSWIWVEIGALSETVGGGTPSATKGNYFDDGTIPWVTPADMSGYTSMYISGGRRSITEAGLQNSSARLLPQGSLLFSSRAPIGYVAIAQNPIATNQGFKSFFPTEAYLPHYGYWYLKSVKSLAESMASGTTFLELSGSKAAKIPFPLAPIAEQRRIVAQLDAAMQKLEASQERLEKLPALLKKFRQAVLAAAVSGKLTEAWRAEHKSGIQSATELLQSISANRQTLWEDNQRTKMHGKQLSLNENWKQKYNRPVAPLATDLVAIPNSWTWASLEQLTDPVRVICYGILMPKENIPDGVMYVKVRDMRGDKIDIGNLQRTTPEIAKEFERASLKEGDILLSIRGTYGRIAHVPVELEGGNITQDSARIALLDGAEKSYVAAFLRSEIAQQYFKKVARGMAVKGVNISDVRPCPVALPPLAEQREIIRQVNHYFDLADQLEARFEQAAALVEQLPQTLLAKAFSGHLVPQDPNDEPASVLLERLAAGAPSPAMGKRGRKPKVVADLPLFE